MLSPRHPGIRSHPHQPKPNIKQSWKTTCCLKSILFQMTPSEINDRLSYFQTFDAANNRIRPSAMSFFKFSVALYFSQLRWKALSQPQNNETTREKEWTFPDCINNSLNQARLQIELYRGRPQTFEPLPQEWWPCSGLTREGKKPGAGL